MPWVKNLKTGRVVDVAPGHWALDHEDFEVIEGKPERGQEVPEEEKSPPKRSRGRPKTQSKPASKRPSTATKVEKATDEKPLNT